jgi:hypothetical protein
MPSRLVGDRMHFDQLKRREVTGRIPNGGSRDWQVDDSLVRANGIQESGGIA